MTDTKLRKTIQLHRPIMGHGGPIPAVVLREPGWDEVMAHGHPFTWHQSPEGALVFVENHAAVLAYAEACCEQPAGGLLLSQLGTQDSLAIRNAILGFFHTAKEEGED